VDCRAIPNSAPGEEELLLLPLPLPLPLPLLPSRPHGSDDDDDNPNYPNNSETQLPIIGIVIAMVMVMVEIAAATTTTTATATHEPTLPSAAVSCHGRCIRPTVHHRPVDNVARPPLVVVAHVSFARAAWHSSWESS
jgi:hypothetical protein